MKNDKTFQMRVDDEFLSWIDTWRDNQPGKPARAEAVRMLVKIGIDATAEPVSARPGHVVVDFDFEPACSIPTAGYNLLNACRNDASHLLTKRERQVLLLVSEGQTNKDIACELDLAESTVKQHVHRVMLRLNANSRSEAAAACISPGRLAWLGSSGETSKSK